MIKVITERPVATDSPDHQRPLGTAVDNTKNPLVNKNFLLLTKERPIKVMDLGCAGGGMVQTLLADGFIAVGLEGSDYCLQRKQYEWATVPDNLFTCDISAPFLVMENEQLMQFHIITAWDVMEHVFPERVDTVCENIAKHLLPGGHFICSIPINSPNFPRGSYGPGDYPWHQVHWEAENWEAKFAKYGLVPKVYEEWDPRGWLRGEDHESCYRKILQKI